MPGGMDLNTSITQNDMDAPDMVFPDWEIQEKPNCPYSPKYTLDVSSANPPCHYSMGFG